MSEKPATARTFTRREMEPYCCLQLVKADADRLVSTASGGVWIGAPREGEGCLSGFPMARYCPFCGSKIVSTKYEGGGWSWHTVPRAAA